MVLSRPRVQPSRLSRKHLIVLPSRLCSPPFDFLHRIANAISKDIVGKIVSCSVALGAWSLLSMAALKS